MISRNFIVKEMFIFKKSVPIVIYNGGYKDCDIIINEYNFNKYKSHTVELDYLINSNFDLIKYFDCYHPDILSQGKAIEIKRSFNFEKYTEPEILIQDVRFNIYNFLSFYDLLNISICSKDYLSEIRSNKFIRSNLNSSHKDPIKESFFQIINNRLSNFLLEYEIWFICSINCYFRYLKQSWYDYLEDAYDINLSGPTSHIKFKNWPASLEHSCFIQL